MRYGFASLGRKIMRKKKIKPIKVSRCPYCNSKDVWYVEQKQIHHCHTCNKKFFITFTLVKE
jgi:ribosomal protein L37AE/L43A